MTGSAARTSCICGAAVDAQASLVESADVDDDDDDDLDSDDVEVAPLLSAGAQADSATALAFRLPTIGSNLLFVRGRFGRSHIWNLRCSNRRSGLAGGV